MCYKKKKKEGIKERKNKLTEKHASFMSVGEKEGKEIAKKERFTRIIAIPNKSYIPPILMACDTCSSLLLNQKSLCQQ